MIRLIIVRMGRIMGNNCITDGGSTALYTAYTADTAYNVDTVYTIQFSKCWMDG